MWFMSEKEEFDCFRREIGKKVIYERIFSSMEKEVVEDL